MKYLIAILIAFAFQPALYAANYDLRPIPYQKIKLQHFDGNDKMRRALVHQGNTYELKTQGGHAAVLVFEADYLTPEQRLRAENDTAEALDEVPAFVGRDFRDDKPLTIFFYRSTRDRPFSYTAPDGLKPQGEGIMLILSDENRDPLFHEVTHATERTDVGSESESLSEGLAEYVDSHFRPGRAHAFTPAKADPDALAAEFLGKFPAADILNRIGAPGDGYSWDNPEERYGFYFASWSFVKFLMTKGSMKDLTTVMDGAGEPSVYLSVYSESFDDLRQEWLRSLIR